MAKSAQSASESATTAPEASASGSSAQAADTPPQSAPEASALEMPPEHVRLRFTGNKLVVIPFGELDDGDLVTAPRAILASLLATGMFTEATNK
jgi:hypothetical protein